MKKLILLTGLALMTSCHSDRFIAIDAILFDQQQQIDQLSFDLEDKTTQLSDRLDNLSDDLNTVSSDLRTSIDSLGIVTSENDLLILGIIYDTIDYVDESFVELNDRITFENQQLQNSIDLNAEDIAAIETNIVELEGELDLALGELEVVITALVQSLHGELLSTVADVLREYLTAEYQQILIEIDNSVTNVTSGTIEVPVTGTSSPVVADTTSQTTDIVSQDNSGPPVINDIFLAELRAYANCTTCISLGTVNGSEGRVDAYVIQYRNGNYVHRVPVLNETHDEFMARIKSILDANT